jgi:hypothetical protein
MGSDVWEMRVTLGIPLLLPCPFCLEVEAIAAGALDGADGGAIETQKCLAALGALEVFLNHMHVPFI